MTFAGVRERSGKLPAALTSFVGREPELATIKETLERARLVTLAGPGGVGKTRLALRAAEQVAGVFRDGVCLVELSSLTDPATLPGQVCGDLSLQDQTARSDTETLVDYLAGRDMLLVLDTCEHLVDSCAILVEVLLRAAPGLRVLTTSRQPLGIPGEHVVPVAPLPLPSVDAGPRQDALGLFVERAVAVDPTFTLTPENLEAAVRLCRRLDGIPLAIELAAVRLRALSVTQLADRLDDRFRMLGQRTASDRRHHTLQASIQWSHELCSPEERLLWARLSVFAGDFDLDAAEFVCDADFPYGVLEPLAGLVEKSILLRSAGPRFRMLDTLREFGEQRLREAGEVDVAARRHRDHYLGLARRFHTEWYDGDQLAWCERLNPEFANIAAALRWCLSDPAEHRAGLELASGLGFFWIATGHTKQGRHLLEAFLDRCPDPTPERAWALWTTSWICSAQTDLVAAERTAAECGRLAEALDDPLLRAWALYAAGFRSISGADLESGAALGRKSAEAFQDAGDALVGRCFALGLQALALSYLGRVEEAGEVLREAGGLADARGERWTRSFTDFVLGSAELRRDVDAAVAHSRAALETKHRMGDQAAMASIIEVLAGAALKTGDPERAARLLGSSQRLWSRVGALDGQGPMASARAECVARTRGLLGDERYEAVFAEGEGLPVDDAVAHALGAEPPPAPRSRRARTLTRREEEVAALVAEGLTNREIAERLVVSKRTADSHVEHILAKLGFGSRAQIAVWATGRNA